MRHHNKNRKFGRSRSQRRALLKSLVLSLIQNEKIETTEAKAKEIRPMIEKLITKGKVSSLATRRLIMSRFNGNAKAAKKIIEVLSVRYKDKKGGYTRIVKISRRKSDASKMAIIKFV